MDVEFVDDEPIIFAVVCKGDLSSVRKLKGLLYTTDMEIIYKRFSHAPLFITDERPE